MANISIESLIKDKETHINFNGKLYKITVTPMVENVETHVSAKISYQKRFTVLLITPKLYQTQHRSMVGYYYLLMDGNRQLYSCFGKRIWKINRTKVNKGDKVTLKFAVLGSHIYKGESQYDIKWLKTIEINGEFKL